jgi:hypothetical protein
MIRVSAVWPVAFFVAFCWCPSVAGADPILVTSGIVDAGGPLSGPWDGEDLELTARGFSVGSSLEDERAFVQPARVPTIAPGALVDWSGVLHVLDPLGARVGDTFGIISAPFEMSFATRPTRVTCSSAGSSTNCTGTTPFTFRAELTFTPFGGAPFTRELTGAGRAEGTLGRFGSFDTARVRYIFASSPRRSRRACR